MTITVAECCVYRASRAFQEAEATHGFDSRPRLKFLRRGGGVRIVAPGGQEGRDCGGIGHQTHTGTQRKGGRRRDDGGSTQISCRHSLKLAR